MLSKEQRLKKSSEFQTVYNFKNSVANSLLILYAGKFKKNQTTPTKAGFVVSKKISKRAVKRNKIKRRIRESYKKHITNYNIPFEKIIILSRNKCVDASYQEIDSAVDHIINRLIKKTK